MFASIKGFAALSIALSAMASAFAFDTSLVARQTTSTCATGVHMMIAGGCALPCTSDELRLLVTLVSNITTAIPGSDYWLVPYDNSQYQGAVSTPLMITAANEYFESCPDTPVVFIGYSLGGIIVMNTLCGGISSTYAPNVIGAIVYGEETYRYPASFDVGTCTNSAPLFPRNNTAQCAPFASSIQSYCDATDPKCCNGGLSPYAHFEYDNKYDVTATNFLVSQYAAYEASSSSSSSSSSSTTSTRSSTTSTSTTVSTTTASTTASTTPSTTVVSTTASTESESSTDSTTTATVLTTVRTTRSTTASTTPSTTFSDVPGTTEISTESTTSTTSTAVIYSNSTAVVVPGTASTASLSTITTTISTSIASTTSVFTTTVSSVGASTTQVLTGTISTVVPVSSISVPTSGAVVVIVSGTKTTTSTAAPTSYIYPTGTNANIPVSAILYSSAVYSSLLSSVSASSVSAASLSSSISAVLATGGTVAASLTATGYSNGTASYTGGVAVYTGAASSLRVPGVAYIKIVTNVVRGVASLVI